MIRINISNPTEVAFCVLNLVNSLRIQYGKLTLSKILHGSESINIRHRNLDKSEYYGCLRAFTQEQISNIIDQLTAKEYLHNLRVGTDYEIIVMGITSKGLDALKKKPEIIINLPKVYAPELKSASDIEVIAKEIIEEYYNVKLQLNNLLKKEETLKEIIKKAMIENDVPKMFTEKMELFCRKVDKVFYPKEKIEEFVPVEILEKIKEVRETIILSAKLKIKEETFKK